MGIYVSLACEGTDYKSEREILVMTATPPPISRQEV